MTDTFGNRVQAIKDCGFDVDAWFQFTAKYSQDADGTGAWFVTAPLLPITVATPGRAPRYRNRRGFARSRTTRRFKGSAAAKRAARQVSNRAKAAVRARQQRKWVQACAHGLARDWHVAWKRGRAVQFTFMDALETGFGIYPRAQRLLIKRLGPGHLWDVTARSVVRLQGPSAEIRPLPMTQHTRNA